MENYIIVYLDDLNVYSRNFNEHLVHLQEVFERLRNVGLKLKAKKYQFFKKELAFLEHVIRENGVKPDPEKVAAIEKHLVSTNITEL